jgi:arylsulfatase A-like enzyme
MIDKRFLSFMLIIFFITGLLIQAWSFNENEPSELPNVLLILSDDHSYPYLGCYGNNDLSTPNLDQLANEGALFTQAYTAASQCVPSRASILSGRNVLDIRMMRFSSPLPKDVKTIPEYLREKGYYTGICGRHYHLDGSAYKAQETIETFEKYDMVTFPDRVHYLKQGSDDEVMGQFTTFLDEVPDGKPFFMWMNYSDPHRRFTAPEYEPDPLQISVPPSMPDIPEVREDLAAHLGEVNRLDENVGLVLNAIKKRGLDKNTLIVFIGDNGAALLRGKGTLYDLGLHVPLIMKWPEHIPEKVKSDVLISGEDLLPTILDAAGMKPNEEVTGKSILPVLKGERDENHKYLFAQRTTHGSGLPIHSARFDVVRTVYNKEYRLIYNVNWRVPYTPVDFNNGAMWNRLNEMHEQGTLQEKFDTAFFANPRPMFELYDRVNDPFEFNNLIDDPKYSEITHELKAALHEWMIVYEDYANLPVSPR